MGPLPDDVPVITRRGELVMQPKRVTCERYVRPITVVTNVTTPDASGFRTGQGQIAADLARAMERARGNL